MTTVVDLPEPGPVTGPLVVDITTSLDGFVAAAGAEAGRPLGVGGDCLHDWVRGGSASGVDRDVLDETRTSFGAYLMGRTTFDIAPDLGIDPISGAPCFVLTRRERHRSVRGRTTYAFVTTGIEHALELAKAAAGGRAIGILGGASIVQQYLRAGLVNEFRLHLVPVLLGAGTRLFDHLGGVPVRLRRIGGIDSPLATHVKYHVVS